MTRVAQRSSNRFRKICSELSADNRKRIALESLSFCTYNCSVSHLRGSEVHLKLSDGITFGESHLRVALDSSASKHLPKNGRADISTFPARALRCVVLRSASAKS